MIDSDASNVCPSEYGASTRESVGVSDRDRDAATLPLARSAIALSRGIAEAGTGEPGTAAVVRSLVNRTLPLPATVRAENLIHVMRPDDIR